MFREFSKRGSFARNEDDRFCLGKCYEHVSSPVHEHCLLPRTSHQHDHKPRTRELPLTLHPFRPKPKMCLSGPRRIAKMRAISVISDGAIRIISAITVIFLNTRPGHASLLSFRFQHR